MHRAHHHREMFKTQYADVFGGDANWRKVGVTGADLQVGRGVDLCSEAALFRRDDQGRHLLAEIKNARILGMFLDSITTDHISPAGSIKEAVPPGSTSRHQFRVVDFNQYGTRRGNHEVMMRGTFGNIRIKNQMVKDETGKVVEGGYTIHAAVRRPPGDL